MPGAKRAAGLTQISATFTLLAANLPDLLHVFQPAHQHMSPASDSPTAGCESFASC